MLAAGRKAQPEPFHRSRVRRDLWLYADGSPRSSKILLVGFTGRAQRMMMPSAVFLQQLDSKKADVALLCDPLRSGYRQGMRRVGESLGSMLNALPQLLHMSEYQSVVSMGTSAGGLPAVLAALQLNLSAAMSVGGASPDDPRWALPDGAGARDLIDRCTKESARLPRLYLVFGEDSIADRTNAEELEALLPAELMPVTRRGKQVGHNALLPLMAEGAIGRTLENSILSRCDN